MSTLVTNTITGLSTAANITIGSTPVVSASATSLTIRGEGAVQTSVQQGLNKAWIKFNGSGTIAINDSFNITSITDNGTGDYDITIANDMGNANYSALYGGGEGSGDSGGRIPNFSTAAAGTLDVYCRALDNSAIDGVVQSIGFFGDLA
jgi:hypothetical protein